MKPKGIVLPPSQPSVLVVDDIPENLQVVGNLLKNHSYDVRLATNGEQAIESARNDPPDLMLLDISMAGIDGFEVCRRIKADPQTESIPVIFLTAAHVSQVQMRKGFEVGAVDYVTKPVDDRVLVARVQTHITLKRSLQLLEIRNRDLSEANDAKNKLFSIFGHDLRNAFSGLNTLIELMLREFDNLDRGEKLHYLGEMERASGQTLTILEDILQWSRLERGVIVPSIRPIELPSILEDTLDVVRPRAEQKEIQLANDWEELPPVKADAEMVHAILRNLLTNAVKFTRRGGSVRLSARPNGGAVQISVSDTGVGIDAARIPSLFRTTSGSESGTDGETGTGLGLLICKELAEKLESEIRVHSDPGVGTTFEFSLPLDRSPTDVRQVQTT